jgi:nanoRNase/pAp phosphatase (c-di-AMP/oligoRNAs hydrolase)
MNVNHQFFNLIKKSNNILISFPTDWNGDAISSSLALALYLKKIGKNVEIGAEKNSERSNFSTPLESFKFLPSFSEIKTSLENLLKFVVSVDLKNAKINQIKYTIENNYLNFIISPKSGFFKSEDIRSSMEGFKYDLIITISCRDLESLGRIYDSNIDFFYKTDIINIDNSPENEDFGQINIIDLNTVSCSEIIYDLINAEEKSHLIDEDIATCLLSGIIFKTKSFKTTNLTPKTLQVSSRLIELGARREEIVSNLYRSRSLSTLKLWGRVLNNLNSINNNSIIWSTLLKNDFDASSAAEENLQDVIDELILSIPSAKVIVLFYSNNEILIPSEDESEDKTAIVHNNNSNDIFSTKVLVYSVKNINALDMIKDLSPSGDHRVAYATSSRPIKEIEQETISNVKNCLEKIF